MSRMYIFRSPAGHVVNNPDFLDQVQAPLGYPPDAGGSQGDAGGGSGDGGDGGGGSATPYKLTDESLVDLGDGKPVKWSEARTTRFMPKERFDEGVKLLTTIAEGWDKAIGSARGAAKPDAKPTGQGQQQQQQRSALDDVENLPVVTGRDLAKIARELSGQSAPLAQLLGQIATRMKALESQVGTISGTAGALAERHSTQEFDRYISTTLGKIPEIKGLGMLPADDPDLQELAKDLYLSHDQSDPQALQKEIPGLLQARVEKLFGLFKKLSAKAASDAQEKRRKFFAPGGGATRPSGGDAYRHQSGSDLARELFASHEASS